MTSADTPESEEELLAMPATRYMDEGQRKFFERRLQALREETEARIAETRRFITSHERTSDELDRALQEGENSQRLRLAERQSLLLSKIDAALGRIRSGRYGYCRVSGEPIGLRRLLHRPTAELSIEEKSRSEWLERSRGKA